MEYTNPIVKEDMKSLMEYGLPLEKLKNKNVLVTGANGMLATYLVYFFMYLNKEISYEKAIEIIKRDTRRYAKRQITWFKRDQRIQWVDVTDKSENEIVLDILPSLGRKFQREVE